MVSMTLSLLAVFIPILFMGGIVGRLFREFAVTLAAAILVSMVVSLTTTPMLCAHLLKPRPPESAPGRWSRWSGRLLRRLKAGYRAGSNWVMNKATLFTAAAFKDYQGRYVFMPTSAPGVADAVLGYPVVEAEDMQDLGSNKFPVAFGNFKLGYLIVDRVGTRIIRDPFSNKPFIGFYTTKGLGVPSRIVNVLNCSSALKVS